MVTAGFPSCYLNGPLPYVQLHITVNKNVLSASLNKTFPSFRNITYQFIYKLINESKFISQGNQHTFTNDCVNIIKNIFMSENLNEEHS